MPKRSKPPVIGKSVDVVPAAPKQESLAMYDFYEAMRALTEGKKIHKISWQDAKWYAFIFEGMVKMHMPDDSIYNWAISQDDLEAEDFILL